MQDEYKFHIEEDFSIHLLAKGVEKVLLDNEMSVNTETLSNEKIVITSTNVRGRGSKVFHKVSGTTFSLSILLEVDGDTLRVLFADQSWDDKGLAFLISIGIPVFALSAGYGSIRQGVIEKEILNYIKDVVGEDKVSFSNMNMKERILCATPLISLIIFLCMGFIGNMWAWGCLAFLLVPLMPIILGEINPEYIFPFVVGGIYIGLGFGLNAWHPAWIIFLTIPVYYILFPIRNKKPLKKNYEY